MIAAAMDDKNKLGYWEPMLRYGFRQRCVRMNFRFFMMCNKDGA